MISNRLTHCVCVLSIIVVASCSVPRGAALQSEIIGSQKENAEDVDFAVYPVTKNMLHTTSHWPKTGSGNNFSAWPPHKHTTSSLGIRPNDTVDLTIWDSEPNSLLTSEGQKVIQMKAVRVNPNGTIFLPYINKVHIAGLSPDSARNKIQRNLENIVPSAQVQLSVTAGTQNSVDLVGGVARPGSFPLPESHFTVMNLISQGGGASTSLKNPRVQLTRGSKTYRISLDHLYANPKFDAVLRGRDKVILAEDTRYFRALGAAGKETLIPFEKEYISALDAMSLIGGISDTRANPEGILILREYSHKAVRTDGSGPSHERVIFTVDLTTADGLFSAGKFQINSQDTVLVTESAVTSVRTVLGLFGASLGVAGAL